MLNRVRKMPVQPRRDGIHGLAKTHHDGALVGIDGVKTARQPDGQPNHQHQGDGRTQRRRGRKTARVVPSARAAMIAAARRQCAPIARAVVAATGVAQHSLQALIEIAPDFFQIGRLIRVLPAATRARIVPVRWPLLFLSVLFRFFGLVSPARIVQ